MNHEKRTEHSFSYQQSNTEGLLSPAMSVQDCIFINSLETKKTLIFKIYIATSKHALNFFLKINFVHIKKNYKCND